MQNFSKKQLTLAVGAALAAAAGGASAATTQSVLNKALVSAGTGFAAATDGKGLYSAAGVKTGKISLKLAITTDNAGTAAAIQYGTDTTGAAASSGAKPTVGIDLASSADTVNNFVIVATDGTTTVNLASLVDSVATMTPGATYNVQANFQDSLLGANDRFRIDSAGALQYSANAGTSWLPVKVSMQNIGDSLGFYVDAADDSINTAADSSNTLKSFAATSVYAGNTIVPTPELATRADTAATVPGSLVNGVTLNTFGALSSLAASNLKVQSRGTLDTLIGTVTIDTVNGGLAASGSANSWTISFSPATANLDTADTTADADLYTAKGFNTGVATTNTPFTIDAASADSLAPVFSTVFLDTVADSTFGTAAPLLKAGSAKGVVFPGANAITDGAQPVVTSSNYNLATKTLTINFSEPVQTNSGAGVASDDILEVVQNVAYGAAPGTTMAAANFNADGDIDSIAVSNTNGIGSLQIGAGTDSLAVGLVAFLNQPLIINKRLSVTEPGEAANSVVDTSFDTFGFKTVSGEILTSTNNTNTISVAQEAVTLAFDGETKAQAVMASDGKNVQKIDITYPYTIAQDSSSSFKDHFKLTVIDGANGASVTPDSTSAFLDASNVSVSGKVVTITLPTSLVLKNMSGVKVEYNTAWGDGKAALKFSDSASSTSGVVASAVLDSNEINLPYYVVNAGLPLYTQETRVDLDNVSSGSKVTGYLAKWLDAKVEDKFKGTGITLKGGKISNPGDKVATDLSLEVLNALDTAVTGDTVSGLLSYLIATELNKDKPAAIPVVVRLSRTNDTASRGSNGSNGEYLQAEASLAATRTAAAATIDNAQDALYEVMLDPKTGNISGRLTGNIRIDAKKPQTVARGLQFIKNDGDFTATGASAAQTAVVVDGSGKANLVIGVDVVPAKQANLKDAFILAVLEDVNDPSNPRLITSAEQGMRNHLPFMPNLLSLKDGRTGLAGLDSSGTTALPLDVAMIKPTTTSGAPGTLAASTAWQLIGVGALDRNAKLPAIGAKDWPRLFVSLTGTTPKANWVGSGDTTYGDFALTMLGNKTGVASENSTSGDTVNTIALGANANPQRFAFAFKNDAAAADPMFFLTKAPTATSLPVGWSLVSAPAAWKTGGLPSGISHMVKVGAGYSTFSTWVSGDGASTNLVENGEPVFVFAKSPVTVAP